MAALILNLAELDAGAWSTSRTRHLTPGKQPRYPLSRRMGRSQSRSGHFVEDEYIFRLPGFEPQIVERDTCLRI
jgi:hypothetical protein